MREAVKDAMSSLNSRAARDVADVNTAAAASASGDSDEDASASSLWQDITSKNSLADVAELHCGITLSKDSRNLFVESDTREQILEHLSELLDYCASDVDVTHKVFQKVWPVFVEENCRHPVTMAGVFDLGSAFLPVDEEWNDYIERSEHCFRTASNSVHESLVKLAEAAREKGCEGLTWGQAQEIASRRQALEEHAALHIESGGQQPLPYVRPDVKDLAEDAAAGPRAWWERDPWLSQLDWSPKKPKKIKLSAGADEDGNELDVPLVADPGHIIVPTWYRDLVVKAPPTGISLRSPVALALAQLSFDGEELLRDDEGRWSTRESGPLPQLEKVLNPLTSTFLKTKVGKAVSSLQEPHGVAAVEALRAKDQEQAKAAIKELAEAALAQSDDIPQHLQELDWTAVQVKDPNVDIDSADFDQPWWPKWYWDIFKPNTGELELTIRSKIAPTLLNVSWRGCPLFHSREHGWLYRIEPEVNQQSDFTTRQKPVEFTHKADGALKLLAGPQHHVVSSRGRETKDLIPDPTRPTFLKVPHSSGDEANVGSPFAKNFISFFDDGTLRSEHPSEEGRQASKAALDLNAQCSYWISARDRVERQMVVWDGENGVDIGSHSNSGPAKLGMILPQVIQMGTVTRRAIEKTWLTASNAKKNRVGSELKSMVKAPPGWSIVGADVDSEELWICSVMGDAQFGVHGATAVGWMTLEGTKAQGTDLHSKTASILGTSRNQAKVFNYSRIYGAGIRHATQLMLKANPSMPSEEAMRRAKQLYAATKGQNTHSNDFFGSKFWYGGSESYVFNKLESIAISDQPRTPALDCGVTAALSRKYLPKRRWMDGKVGEDYMPSRINWVVQSSGVDYLHMLTAAMTHLCKTYDIKARFMLSVHDEVRYLCREEDRYRTALALQIANLWTRAMFAYRLDFDDLPQGCAFFSQVDIDRVLRKEVDDPCVTPSHPVPVPPGEALTIDELLAKTHNGSLAQAAGSTRSAQCPAFAEHPLMSPTVPAFEWHPQTHRSSGQKGLLYLQAQATSELDEIRSLDRRAKQLDQAAKMPLSKTARRPFVPRAPGPSASAVRAYSVSSTAQSSTSILDVFPTAPNRPRQPFFKMARHRSETLRLYRALMRATAQWPHLRESLRITAKANKRQTSPGRVNSQLLAAQKLLDLLHSANAGSAEAKTKLHTREARLAENKRRKRLDNALKILEPPAPVPRISGALLRPSLFNPPLPRFKPVQPEAITMMIAKRRMRRAARRRYRADNAELLASLSQELRIQSALGNSSSPWADPAGWFGPLEEAQAAISATFDADLRRAQMVFPESMLRQAKQARRSKLRARLRRAYRRAQQQSLDIDL